MTSSTLVLTSLNLVFVSTFLIDFLGSFKSTACHPLEKERKLYLQHNQRLKICISTNHAPSLLRYFRISTSKWQSWLCNAHKVQITARCSVSDFQLHISALENSVRVTQLPWLYHPKMCSHLVFSNYVILRYGVMTLSSTSVSAHFFVKIKNDESPTPWCKM